MKDILGFTKEMVNSGYTGDHYSIFLALGVDGDRTLVGFMDDKGGKVDVELITKDGSNVYGFYLKASDLLTKLGLIETLENLRWELAGCIEDRGFSLVSTVEPLLHFVKSDCDDVELAIFSTKPFDYSASCDEDENLNGLFLRLENLGDALAFYKALNSVLRNIPGVLVA